MKVGAIVSNRVVCVKQFQYTVLKVVEVGLLAVESIYLIRKGTKGEVVSADGGLWVKLDLPLVDEEEELRLVKLKPGKGLQQYWGFIAN